MWSFVLNFHNKVTEHIRHYSYVTLDGTIKTNASVCIIIKWKSTVNNQTPLNQIRFNFTFILYTMNGRSLKYFTVKIWLDLNNLGSSPHLYIVYYTLNYKQPCNGRASCRTTWLHLPYGVVQHRKMMGCSFEQPLLPLDCQEFHMEAPSFSPSIISLLKSSMFQRSKDDLSSQICFMNSLNPCCVNPSWLQPNNALLDSLLDFDPMVCQHNRSHYMNFIEVTTIFNSITLKALLQSIH